MTTSPPSPKNKFELPAWIPYPSSWIRAIVLVFFFAALVILVRIAGFWGFIITAITDDITHLVRYVGLAFLTAILLYAYSHHFLVGKSPQNYPQWLPSPQSLWEGACAIVIIFLATIIAAFLVTPFYEESHTLFYNGSAYFTNTAAAEKFLTLLATVWFVAALYLYQLEFIWHKKKRPKTRSHSAQPTDVTRDVALDTLLNDLTTGQNPTPTIQDSTRTNSRRFKSPKKFKYLLYFSIIPLFTCSIFLAINIYNFLQPKPVSVAVSQTTATAQQDPFTEAVNQATKASQLAQTAQTSQEWQIVAETWKSAIAWMQAVPVTHIQYATAQQKATEYQPNLQYAQQNSQ
ncbi:MAG: hypothetical protein SAJ12_11530 [Jaaginema sp. PMC 1079.18]|nr:hypothetical protein [Jaaginema sp. PMC 1080.18]MEC4851635.1 hypothetical protein [Jaaginema sp. PMC 1079.18]MEC4866732.1 hypothetical protein [Jaaginema sp. PMC 1078.18]